MKILNQQVLVVVMCVLFGKAMSVGKTCLDSNNHKSEPGPESSLYNVVSIHILKGSLLVLYCMVAY